MKTSFLIFTIIFLFILNNEIFSKPAKQVTYQVSGHTVTIVLIDSKNSDEWDWILIFINGELYVDKPFLVANVTPGVEEPFPPNTFINNYSDGLCLNNSKFVLFDIRSNIDSIKLATFSSTCLNDTALYIYNPQPPYTSNEERGLSGQIEIDLFPNPTLDIIHIICETSINIIEIFDLNLKKVKSFRLEQSFYEFEVDISSFISGIYYIRVSNSTGKFVSKKFIKH